MRTAQMRGTAAVSTCCIISNSLEELFQSFVYILLFQYLQNSHLMVCESVIPVQILQLHYRKCFKCKKEL